MTLGVSVGNITRDTEADTLAAKADLSIIFVSDRFSEGCDNNLGLSLPGDQDAMISRLAKLSRKTLVLNTNSAILLPWLDEVDAIIEAGYSGQQVGLAPGRLLFGEVNPSGKLPMTFPKSLYDTIQIWETLDTDFKEDLYVGYKRYDEHSIAPLFPFGHGLSYTTFNLSELQLSSVNTSTIATVVASMKLSNIGSTAGKEVVQVYVMYPAAAMEPPKLLKGFEKVFLEAGEETDVAIMIETSDLRIWDERTEDWSLVAGEYTFLAGFSAGNIILQQSIHIS